MFNKLERLGGLVVLYFFTLLFTCNAHALVLTNQCSAGQGTNGVSVTDVTGNLSGATDCFGTFAGTEPGSSSDLSFGGSDWSYVGGVELNDGKSVTVGDDVGQFLDVNAGGQSGYWYLDPNLFSASSFIIVLQTVNNPTWAAYLFDGAAAGSDWGAWSVAWNDSLSVMSIYAGASVPGVPEPSSIALLAVALIAVGFKLKRVRSK